MARLGPAAGCSDKGRSARLASPRPRPPMPFMWARGRVSRSGGTLPRAAALLALLGRAGTRVPQHRSVGPRREKDPSLATTGLDGLSRHVGSLRLQPRAGPGLSNTYFPGMRALALGSSAAPWRLNWTRTPPPFPTRKPSRLPTTPRDPQGDEAQCSSDPRERRRQPLPKTGVIASPAEQEPTRLAWKR